MIERILWVIWILAAIAFEILFDLFVVVAVVIGIPFLLLTGWLYELMGILEERLNASIWKQSDGASEMLNKAPKENNPNEG